MKAVKIKQESNLPFEDEVDKLKNSLNRKDHIIAWLIFIVVALLVVIHAIETNSPNTPDNTITVPKMQGFYQSLKDNYVVAVIGTADKNGQQLAGELQNAIKQINQLQLQGRTTK